MAKRQVKRMIDTIKRGQQPYSDNEKIYRGTTRCVILATGKRTTCQAGRYMHDWLNRRTVLKHIINGAWYNTDHILVWP